MLNNAIIIEPRFLERLLLVIEWIVPRFLSRNNVTAYVEHKNLPRELEVVYTLTTR